MLGVWIAVGMLLTSCGDHRDRADAGAESIAFVASRDGIHTALYRIDANGGHLRRLTTATARSGGTSRVLGYDITEPH